MNTETVASPKSPLWKSQLTRWLQTPVAGSADPSGHPAPGPAAQNRGDGPARSAPRPAWPRVFPGL
jgi:hypothetical protein